MYCERVIGVIDADSFEVSIYQKLPEYRNTVGSPCVVSIRPRSERIVSVSPEAKKLGINRSMTVSEALTRSPDLIVIPKTSEYNKPESKRLRTASYELRDAILEYFFRHSSDCGSEDDDLNSNVVLEVNGNDEYFLDLTRPAQLMFASNEEHCLDTRRKVIIECSQGQYYGTRLNFIKRHAFMGPEDFEDELIGLAYGAGIMQELCEFVKDKIGYQCSAGVGANKVAAKIACKLHKPVGVVVLTPGGIPRVSTNFNYRDITGLGGALGERLSRLFGNEMAMSQLTSICNNKQSRDFQKIRKQFTQEEIQKITQLSQGICYSSVEPRLMSRLVSSGKNNLNFNFRNGYKRFQDVMFDLAEEIADRAQEECHWNRREAQELKFIYQYLAGDGRAKEENFRLTGYRFGSSAQNIYNEAYRLAVIRNNSFPYHIGGIVSVKFTITKFHTTDDVVELLKDRVR